MRKISVWCGVDSGEEKVVLFGSRALGDKTVEISLEQTTAAAANKSAQCQ